MQGPYDTEVDLEVDDQPSLPPATPKSPGASSFQVFFEKTRRSFRTFGRSGRSGGYTVNGPPSAVFETPAEALPMPTLAQVYAAAAAPPPSPPPPPPPPADADDFQSACSAPASPGLARS